MRRHRLASSLKIQAVGGPTMLMELAGVRILTDPTFDPPGTYPIGARVLTKTAGPAITTDAIGPLDVILLSHDQHADNLDDSGREMLARAPLVLSTPAAASRLSGVRGLMPWEEVQLPCRNGSTLTLVALPAQHGPDGSEHLTGPVTGFFLGATGSPTVYVSGDNASLEVVDQVAQRFSSIDIAVLFAGAARTPLLPDAYLTLTSSQAATAVQQLGVRWVIPAHYNSWSHYSEGPEDIVSAFSAAGLSDRLLLLAPGEHAELSVAGQAFPR